MTQAEPERMHGNAAGALPQDPVLAKALQLPMILPFVSSARARIPFLRGLSQREDLAPWHAQ